MTVKVELEIDITGDAPIDEVEEFLQFTLHYNGQCPADNPFFNEEKDCDYAVKKFSIEEL